MFPPYVAGSLVVSLDGPELSGVPASPGGPAVTTESRRAVGGPSLDPGGLRSVEGTGFVRACVLTLYYGTRI